MADIDIVPKRRTGSWVWILVAVVVLALILWMMMSRGNAGRSGALDRSGVHGGAVQAATIEWSWAIPSVRAAGPGCRI